MTNDEELSFLITRPTHSQVQSADSMSHGCLFTSSLIDTYKTNENNVDTNLLLGQPP